MRFLMLPGLQNDVQMGSRWKWLFWRFWFFSRVCMPIASKWPQSSKSTFFSSKWCPPGQLFFLCGPLFKLFFLLLGYKIKYEITWKWFSPWSAPEQVYFTAKSISTFFHIVAEQNDFSVGLVPWPPICILIYRHALSMSPWTIAFDLASFFKRSFEGLLAHFWKIVIANVCRQNKKNRNI